MRLIIEDIRHLKLKENLLWLGTTTLVTVIIWIVYAIYVAYNQPQIDTTLAPLLQPLNPSLDQQALALLDDQVTPPSDFTVVIAPSDNSTSQSFSFQSNRTATTSTTLNSLNASSSATQ